MTLPDQDPPRKHNRWFLYWVWIAFALILFGWSGAWIVLRSQGLAKIDSAAQSARDAGWHVEWQDRHLVGFPFRLELVLDGLTLNDPSGWGIETPQLRAEAYAYSPGRAVAYAPNGLTLLRPGKPPMTIGGTALRAGINTTGAGVPNLSVQGQTLTFSNPAGATPSTLTRVSKLGIFMRPGPQDQGEVVFQLDGAVADPNLWLGRASQGKPVHAVFDGVFNKAYALQGRDWAGMVRAWTAAGGQMAVRKVQITAGDAALNAANGMLTVGDDGRLRGTLNAELAQGPRALAAIGGGKDISPTAADAAAAVAKARQGDTALARVDIAFEADQTTLGPVALGPAPRVF